MLLIYKDILNLRQNMRDMDITGKTVNWNYAPLTVTDLNILKDNIDKTNINIGLSKIGSYAHYDNEIISSNIISVPYKTYNKDSIEDLPEYPKDITSAIPVKFVDYTGTKRLVEIPLLYLKDTLNYLCNIKQISNSCSIQIGYVSNNIQTSGTILGFFNTKFAYNFLHYDTVKNITGMVDFVLSNNITIEDDLISNTINKLTNSLSALSYKGFVIVDYIKVEDIYIISNIDLFPSDYMIYDLFYRTDITETNEFYFMLSNMGSSKGIINTLFKKLQGKVELKRISGPIYPINSFNWVGKGFSISETPDWNLPNRGLNIDYIAKSYKDYTMYWNQVDLENRLSTGVCIGCAVKQIDLENSVENIPMKKED